jgi:formylglycine-generating enzyme required for sulfatase activity
MKRMILIAVLVLPFAACYDCDGGGELGIEMVRIRGGTFTMGSSDSADSEASPPHQVTLSAFYMGKYEVTQAQYQEVMGINPSDFISDPAAGDIQRRRPVEMVTWYDAVEFCNKLSKREGRTPVYTISGRTPATGSIIIAEVTANWNANGYRLPTDAEWEYACRAGTTTAYNTGNTISNNTGWYNANSGGKTHEVGKKPPNAWGLYDMHGNVFEWCWNMFETYTSNAKTNPTGSEGTAPGLHRVIRGGFWGTDEDFMRSANRVRYTPGDGRSITGFRIVRR